MPKRYPRDGARLGRKDHRLYVRYFQDDTHADVTPRFGNAEVNTMFDLMFTRENMKRLREMGYDLESMRFHIDRTPEAIENHERRAGRRP